MAEQKLPNDTIWSVRFRAKIAISRSGRVDACHSHATLLYQLLIVVDCTSEISILSLGSAAVSTSINEIASVSFRIWSDNVSGMHQKPAMTAIMEQINEKAATAASLLKIIVMHGASE